MTAGHNAGNRHMWYPIAVKILKCNSTSFNLVVEFTVVALLCNVLCREGVQFNVLYLGGFSMRGQIWG